MGNRGEPRFRLLGTMTADAGPGAGPAGQGGPLDLGHDRQRCVLAVLLVEANRPVAVPVLLDRAWGDRLPQRPRDALYSYLSRLRPILAATGARLERCRGGYTLALDPLDVDLHRFDDLVRRSRGAPDADRAAADLERALALWTGEAFGALDTPWLNSMRIELAQRHRAAERARDDLALQLGRHRLVAPDLLIRAGRDPLDERLAGQAMLALYRCGQRALALTRYEDLRRRLAEGLGTEPSEPLRRLHQQMLRADPALVVPDTPPIPDAVPVPDIPFASTGPVVPQQLPPGPASFTGRDAELADLTAAFDDPAPGTGTVLSLIGTGGVGKTWLALRWAHRYRHRFPDGQLYVNLRGFDPGGDPLEPAAVVRSFLTALGVPTTAVPADAAGQAALYRALLADRRVLVVLDNARDSVQVVPLLPGSPGCAVLVTSRRRLTGLVAAHGAWPVPVGLMSDAEARQLLRARLGAARLAAAPAAVGSLLAHCAGLPLALGIVAAQAATDPAVGLADLAGALADRETRLDLLDAGELALGLRAVLDSSVRTLSAPAAGMLGHLGLAPGPDTGLAAAVSAAGPGQGAAAVRRALRELVDANLISEDGHQRYRMHDLVRLYAIELTAGTEGRCALTRLLDHYLHTGHAALQQLRPLEQRPALAPPAAGVRVEQFADRAAATAWFAAECQVLVAAVGAAEASGAEAASVVAAGAEAAGRDRQTWQLAWVCLYQLDQRGDWAGQVAVSELALAAARRLGDDTALAHAHTGLGRGYAGSGRFDAARVEFNDALAAYRRLGDPVGEGFAYRKLARVHAVQGRPADALAEDRRALARFEAAGHDYGRAVVLNALGWHLAHLGRYAEAVDCCQQAIAIQQRLPDPYGEALTWDSIAYAWYRQGEHNLAVTGYRRAARLIREQRNHLLEAQVMEHLGDAYAAVGSQRAACAAWRRAADLLTGLGHPHVEPVHAKLRQAGAGMADAIRSRSA